MSCTSFNTLLATLEPRIAHQNTRMRLAVPVAERLAVTLRYFATGNSFASLHYEYLLGETTIREIVRDTSDGIWECLLPVYMAPKKGDDWLNIAKDFYERTNFPNCIGAVDGKHIRMKKPNSSGSEFFNYKSFCSTVLLAIADADYCFTSVEVGAFGSASDSNIFKKSKFGTLLERGELGIPGPRLLPSEDTGTAMPFVILGDEAFAALEHVLRPYPNRNLAVTKRIFNYRLSRARRMVECSFGILASKWRIFHRPLDTSLEFSDSIVKACCILHNFVRKHDGVCFDDTLYEFPLHDIDPIGTRGSLRGVQIRDYFAKYFTSPQGCVPWQYNQI